ncbi:uncharacterized protein METZ01_LOCUS343282, partial [marine metagenome]
FPRNTPPVFRSEKSIARGLTWKSKLDKSANKADSFETLNSL